MRQVLYPGIRHYRPVCPERIQCQADIMSVSDRTHHAKSLSCLDLSFARAAGCLVGSLLWPWTSDYIGRRPAFNISLGLISVFGLITAGMPNFTSLAIMTGLIGISLGGNPAVDGSIFAEFVPATHQYLLCVATVFPGVGRMLSVLISWCVRFACLRVRDLCV
jgi:hypothetical protein